MRAANYLRRVSSGGHLGDGVSPLGRGPLGHTARVPGGEAAIPRLPARNADTGCRALCTPAVGVGGLLAERSCRAQARGLVVPSPDSTVWWGCWRGDEENAGASQAAAVSPRTPLWRATVRRCWPT
jgi:hypothetical protein